MKIKVNELKVKLLRGGNDLIDVYFAGNGPTDKIINATVKIILNQNIDKFDDVLSLFSDKDGYIDTDYMIAEYSKAFGTDKIILDLRDYINNDMVRKLLPNKALAIKIDDIANILK